MASSVFPCEKALGANSWAELMDGTPAKPNGKDAPDRPGQTVPDATHPSGRFAGQRATPQSPNEGLPPPRRAANPAEPQAARAFGVQRFPLVSVDRGDRLHVRARLEPPTDAWTWAARPQPRT